MSSFLYEQCSTPTPSRPDGSANGQPWNLTNRNRWLQQNRFRWVYVCCTVQCNRSSKQHCAKLPHLLTSCASDFDVDESIEQSNYSDHWSIWLNKLNAFIGLFHEFWRKAATTFFPGSASGKVFIFSIYILYKNIITVVNIVRFRGWINKKIHWN